MRLIIILFLLSLNQIFSFKIPYKLNNNIIQMQNKTNSFIKLSRPQNIIPVAFLSFSGGYLINPSITNLLHNSNFILSSVITSLIMSTSMIINDVSDIEIDKINSKNRPLITGEITKFEAIISIISLTSLIEYLNLYLSPNLQVIVQLSLLGIYIYTPIIKKIFFLKNLFCASLVSFSIFIAGLSSSTSILAFNKNYDLFLVELSLIFFGSLYNEILLDITDIVGDKQNNIYTIPVIFGKRNTLILECIILLYNMISSFYTLSFFTNIYYASGLEFIFIPFIYDLYIIFKNDLDDKKIKESIQHTHIPLFLSIIYLCFLQNIL